MTVAREGAPVDGRYNAWCGCCDAMQTGTVAVLLEAGWVPAAGASWWYCPEHAPSCEVEQPWHEAPMDFGPNTFAAMFESFPEWVYWSAGRDDDLARAA